MHRLRAGEAWLDGQLAAEATGLATVSSQSMRPIVKSYRSYRPSTRDAPAPCAKRSAKTSHGPESGADSPIASPHPVFQPLSGPEKNFWRLIRHYMSILGSEGQLWRPCARVDRVRDILKQYRGRAMLRAVVSKQRRSGLLGHCDSLGSTTIATVIRFRSSHHRRQRNDKEDVGRIVEIIAYSVVMTSGLTFDHGPH